MPINNRLSDDTVKGVLDACVGGEPLKVIAARWSVNRSSIYRLRKRHNIARGRYNLKTGTRVPHDKVEEVLRACQAGELLDSISRRTGLARSTIYSIRKNAGMALRFSQKIDKAMEESIRADRAAGVSQAFIARKLDVAPSTIQRIFRGKKGNNGTSQISSSSASLSDENLIKRDPS